MRSAQARRRSASYMSARACAKYAQIARSSAAEDSNGEAADKVHFRVRDFGGVVEYVVIIAAARARGAYTCE